MRETTVRVLGPIAFIGVLIFSLYYPYKLLGWMWLLDFSGPSGWHVLYFVESTVQVPFRARLIHFVMWLPSAIATQISLLAALYLIWLVIKQAYFELRTVTALQVSGAAAAIGAVCNLIAGGLDGWFLTRFNTDARLQVSFRLESGETGVLLTGIGLFLLGWVIRLARIKHAENSEMV